MLMAWPLGFVQFIGIGRSNYMMSFVYVCVCRSEISFGCYSSGTVHVIFQGRVMTGTLDLPVKPGWLVSLSSTGLAGTDQHTLCFMWVLGIKLGRQALYQLSCFSFAPARGVSDASLHLAQMPLIWTSHLLVYDGFSVHLLLLLLLRC